MLFLMKPKAAQMKSELNKFLAVGKECLFVLRLSFTLKLAMLLGQVGRH